MSSSYIISDPHKYIIILMLQGNKLSIRKIKSFVQGHTPVE